MRLNALAAGVLFAAMSTVAHAELIERTFDVTASDFVFSSGDPTPPPVDPVELNFTVIFDTSSGVLIGTSDGLTINSFTLPDPPYSSKFTFDPVTGFLAIATLPQLDGCGFAASTYCFVIVSAAGASPGVGLDFAQETASQGVWLAQSITVTAGEITVVPEPSTWALMLVGFSGLGWLAFRRRAAPAGAA